MPLFSKPNFIILADVERKLGKLPSESDLFTAATVALTPYLEESSAQNHKTVVSYVLGQMKPLNDDTDRGTWLSALSDYLKINKSKLARACLHLLLNYRQERDHEIFAYAGLQRPYATVLRSFSEPPSNHLITDIFKALMTDTVLTSPKQFAIFLARVTLPIQLNTSEAWLHKSLNTTFKNIQTKSNDTPEALLIHLQVLQQHVTTQTQDKTTRLLIQILVDLYKEKIQHKPEAAPLDRDSRIHDLLSTLTANPKSSGLSLSSQMMILRAQKVVTCKKKSETKESTHIPLEEEKITQQGIHRDETQTPVNDALIGMKNGCS